MGHQKRSIQLIDDGCLEKMLKSNRTCLRRGTRPDHCIHPGHPFACPDSVNSSIDRSMVHLDVALGVVGVDDAIAAVHPAVGDDDAVAASCYDCLADRNGSCDLCLDLGKNHVHGCTLKRNKSKRHMLDS